jgi:response regulator NasT
VIEQAKGVVMATRGCSADEAFSVLVRLSQESGRKLHLVARTVVDHVTGGDE